MSDPRAPIVAEGPIASVAWPGPVTSTPRPMPIRPELPTDPGAVAAVEPGSGCAGSSLDATGRALCHSPTATWQHRQLADIQGWKLPHSPLPAVVGPAETGAMRSAVAAWLRPCGGDTPCVETRQQKMLQTLTKSIDAAGWGGRYSGEHWALTIVPAQYVGEVNALFTLDAGGGRCAIALTGLRMDLEEWFPLPDPRDGGIGGQDRLVLADPGGVRGASDRQGLIRVTRVGDHVWVHRQGGTPALDRQCRAGAIYGEYRKLDALKPKVSYLGAPGLLPLPPHIMVPGD